MASPLVVHNDAQAKLRITEVFFSLQGESTRSGLPCAMVRLTGCNLRCRWCDSEYTFSGGDWMSLDDIMAQVATYKTRRVEITGGEPLLQPATPLRDLTGHPKAKIALDARAHCAGVARLYFGTGSNDEGPD